MKQLAYVIGLLALIIPASCQSPYVVSDHTAENLFTSGIEGPAFDKKGNLYVVNFGKEGTIGHFNFVGDSILGSHVNMEAGSVIANHFNERKDKTIHVLVDGKLYAAGSEKFGALIGDHTKIGANAVLSPGTILEPESVVKRLALVEQHSGK